MGTATAASPSHASGASQIMSFSGQQKAAQRVLGWRVGDDQRVLNAIRVRTLATSLDKRSHRVLVFAARGGGVDDKCSAGLEIGELEVALVREVELKTAEDLKHRDIVADPRRPPQLRKRCIL